MSHGIDKYLRINSFAVPVPEVDVTAKPKEVRRTLRAFCLSQVCNQYQTFKNDKRKKNGDFFRSVKYRGRTEKEVPRTDDYCPDCKHALFWERT